MQYDSFFLHVYLFINSQYCLLFLELRKLRERAESSSQKKVEQKQLLYGGLFPLEVEAWVASSLCTMLALTAP